MTTPAHASGHGRVAVVLDPSDTPLGLWEAGSSRQTGVAAGGSPWFPVTDTPLGPLAYVRDPAGHAIALVAISDAGRTMIS